MNLLRLRYDGTGPYLIRNGDRPVKERTKDLRTMATLALDVPGARFEDSKILGANHAIAAVLHLQGEGVPGSLKPVPIDGDVWEENALPASIPGYQRGGIQRIYSDLERGVACNDDMGLGKTVQTIAALNLRDEDQKVIKIVLCPALLRTQWKEEIEKWVPLLTPGKVPRVQVFFPPSDRRTKIAPPPNPDWLVAYYGDAHRCRAITKERRAYFFLAVDEVHNLRSTKGAKASEVRGLATFASGRVTLTASPLYNDAARVYPILDMVQPGAWGSYWEFAVRYAGAQQGEWGMVIGKLTNVAELNERMKYMSFRRAKEDVQDQLPFECTYQLIKLDNSVPFVKSAQPKSHLESVALAKVPAVVEKVASDREAGLPGIVFTYLRAQAQALATAIPDALLVIGGDDAATRLARIKEYVAKCKARDVVPVVVGTMGALSEGANLQWAKAVNFAALDYTPDVVRQAIGRAARMGQTGTVQVRIFSMRGTADERITQLVIEKLTQQFKFDGRPEAAKKSLKEVLDPGVTPDLMRSIYEKYMREEGLMK